MTFAWAPTPSDLRDEMIARDLSDVTDGQLQATLDRVAASLNAELGGLLNTRWNPVASAYVLYAAAAQVELRLFPEQQVGVDSQSSRYDTLAGAELSRLRTGLGLGTTSSDGGTVSPTGAFSIPMRPTLSLGYETVVVPLVLP